MLFVAPEVAAHLGTAVVDRMTREIHTTSPLCEMCHTAISPDDDANVIVREHWDHTVIVLAHPGCAPSQLSYSDRPIGDMLQQPTEDDMLSVGALLPTLTGHTPWLFIQKTRGATIYTAQGDVIEPQSSDLLLFGWQTHTRLGRQPPSVTSTRLALADDGSGQIELPTGILLDRLPNFPPGWLEQVLAEGTVNVGFGDFDLHPDRAHLITLDNFQNAARDARMIAARVPILVRDETFNDPRRDLGAMLEETMQTRARKGGADPLNSARQIADLGRVEPTLHLVALSPTFSGLVINLHHTTDADAVLTSLTQYGFERRAELFTKVWPVSETLGALVWPSQVAVLDGDGGKLIFSTITTDRSWYTAVRASGSLGLIVTQLIDVTEDNLSAAAQDGAVAITTFPAMPTS